MYGIYLIFTLIFIWFGVAGATLASYRFCPHFAIARSLGILAFVLIMFFIEHFVGLGSLMWLLPVLLLISGILFWQNADVIKSRAFVVSELIFLAAFLYAFMWRFSFPSITPSSERMTDLFFITNYLSGVSLPPVDNWNPPHLFDYYYAFQHYGAALLGRMFNLGPGETYNFAFGLLAALPITLLVFAAQRLIGAAQLPRLQANLLLALLTASIVFGGTGFTPLLKLVYDAPAKETYVKPNMSANGKEAALKRYRSALASQSRDHIIGAVRYIGSDRDKNLDGAKNVNQSLAKVFFPNTTTLVKGKKMTLPSENLGYQYFLGDYHPTVGGFFLLTLVLGIMLSLLPGAAVPASAAVEKELWPKLAQGALSLCVPLMMITNTWTMPLLVLLIVAWMIYRLLSKLPIFWPWMIGGGVAGTFLIYPFMTGFLTSTLSTPIAFVPEEMHTPLSRFIALQWPVIVLIAMGFWEGRYRKIAWMFSGLWLFLLILSEVIYIDDPTGDYYSRTNTVMKWWGWIQVGVFISLGALLLSSSIKWLRWACAGVLFIIAFSASVDIQRYWLYTGKHYAGYMEGHRWYTNNATNRQMFEYLQAAPHGVVLEPILDNAYSNTSIYGIFNGKPVLLGWPSHLRTWHGSVPRIWIMKDEIGKFYKGEKEDALIWLQGNKVEYIVFGPKSSNKAFDKIHEQIKTDYAWLEFEHSKRRHTGIWVRK
ncbi:Uncharacterized membrane protein [Alteromonadaceae bacterium Bs31]|nr:Uncharacterized membrane protein [Alteromonadaceae bacterium Bs31]